MLTRHHILLSLEHLSRLLEPTVERHEQFIGEAIRENPFRGLAIEPQDARNSLRQSAAQSIPPELVSWRATVGKDPCYLTLKKVYGSLVEIEFGLLLLALAPEVEDRYEVVFAYLQDDVTRRRASIELALSLFDPTGETHAATHLGDSGTLLVHRLIELADPGDGRTGWGAKILRLDEQFSRHVFGVATLDRRLVAFANVYNRRVAPLALPDGHPLWVEIERLTGVRPFRLYLHGPDARLHIRLTEKLAARAGRHLLVADLSRLTGTDRSVPEVIWLLLREARWFKYVLVFTGLDSMTAPDRHRVWEQLTVTLATDAAAVFIMTGSRPVLPPVTHPLGIMSLEVAMPDADERFDHWTGALEAEQKAYQDSPQKTPLVIELPVADREVLAERYSLTRTQIELAVADGLVRARQRAACLSAPDTATVTFDDLAIAARSQGGQDLETLTTKITPKVMLDDLVVPPDVRSQLTEVVDRMRHRTWVLRDWGFARRQSHGLGVNALFAGPSGTGKTMAAEALAHAIGKDLYKIDLTTVVSKYIGETEQKLEQVFRAGEATQAVLFLDEADSLLGKRSEVKDAHDRYANLEVSYLLQRMERYDGLIVLATNLLGNLDEAFLRRMAAIVHFAPPGVAERRLLWQQVWPKDDKGHLMVPIATASGYALDYDFLAERFELTGGNIRNAALAAAFAAAARPHAPVLTMRDVLIGIRREFQKLGQMMSDADLKLDRFLRPPTTPSGVQTPTKPADPVRNGYVEVGSES